MLRDFALVCLVGAFVFFLFGIAIGTSKFLGMALAWGLACLLLLSAIVLGARAFLIDRFMPER